MTSDKIYVWLATAVICSLLLTAGCTTELAEQKATLALKFKPQDSATYKVTTQLEDGIKFEGSSLKEADFKNSRNHKSVEMTFAQQIQSTDNKGNAVAKITIKGLKYLSIHKDKTILDFDSSRKADANSPMAKLIGQSYTIEIAPTSEVSKIIDVEQAKAAVKGGSSVNRAALELLSPDAIKERHTVSAMPAADKNRLKKGDNWSSVKSFSFGLMGAKSYERIYTLKEIEDQGGQRIAIIEMNAIPTSEMTEQLRKEQATSVFSRMFDNIDTYTGQLRLDLTTGKVEKYFEKLQSQWVAVDTEAVQEGKEPAALKMSAVRAHSLEKVD
jgi:hypothetical protein